MGPDGVPGDILKVGGEAMFPFLARLLDITVNNATIPSDWKRATFDPIYTGEFDRLSQTRDQSDLPQWYARKRNTP